MRHSTEEAESGLMCSRGEVAAKLHLLVGVVEGT